MLFGFFAAINDFLHRPWIVLWSCVAVAFANLVLDGTLFRLWTLQREQVELKQNSITIEKEITKLAGQIKQAKDPVFWEREARDRFDLVNEGDLVFVFADEE